MGMPLYLPADGNKANCTETYWKTRHNKNTMYLLQTLPYPCLQNEGLSDKVRLHHPDDILRRFSDVDTILSQTGDTAKKKKKRPEISLLCEIRTMLPTNANTNDGSVIFRPKNRSENRTQLSTMSGFQHGH